jgi:antitoxin PrlF
MIESSITKKGQTTLPKPVRETLGVQAGDRVRYVISNGGRSPDQSTVRHATA